MIVGDYRCLDCKDEFGSRMECCSHHLQTKHQNFELIGSEIKMTIKS